MKAYAIKFARFPSWDIALVAPNWDLTITPIGFWSPVTKEIIAKRKNMIAMARTLLFFFDIVVRFMLIIIMVVSKIEQR